MDLPVQRGTGMGQFWGADRGAGLGGKRGYEDHLGGEGARGKRDAGGGGRGEPCHFRNTATAKK